MIQIVRGPEPQELIDAREEHLSRACLEDGADGVNVIDGYQVSRDVLNARQFTKCAYCECWAQQESQPVEHFRPKGRPARIDWTALREHRAGSLASLDEVRFQRGLPPLMLDRVRWPVPRNQTSPETGYWWLAWTWENLVFGCQSCNGASRKGTRFPLAKGSPTLGVHEQPPGHEQALLLDPTDPSTDPMSVIRFRSDGKHWRPFPVNDDARAAWTIALLGLDSPSLLTLYTAKIKTLEQMARAFRMSFDPGRPVASIGAEWSELHRSALDPAETFLALTHDWLAATFELEIQRHGLSLLRPFLCHPAAIGNFPRQSPLPHRAELDGLPVRLQYRIRMIRHAKSTVVEDVRALLVEVCRERPSTTEELVRLMDRPTALPGHLAMLDGRELVCDPTTGRWHPAA